MKVFNGLQHFQSYITGHVIELKRAKWSLPLFPLSAPLREFGAMKNCYFDSSFVTRRGCRTLLRIF